MKITKIGHCCLLIEERGARILTDPGNYSTGQNTLTNVDAIVITHEHKDHLHIESLKQVLANNPQARVISNTAVSGILEKENIKCEIVGHKEETDVNGVLIQGFGDTHAEIYITIPPVENTGYLFNSEFFYPGDSFYDPGCPVKILALPVAGPWMKTSEAIEYARTIHPKVCFPVHDGFFSEEGPFHRVPRMILENVDIPLETLSPGETKEF